MSISKVRTCLPKALRKRLNDSLSFKRLNARIPKINAHRYLIFLVNKRRSGRGRHALSSCLSLLFLMVMSDDIGMNESYVCSARCDLLTPTFRLLGELVVCKI